MSRVYAQNMRTYIDTSTHALRILDTTSPRLLFEGSSHLFACVIHAAIIRCAATKYGMLMRKTEVVGRQGRDRAHTRTSGIDRRGLQGNESDTPEQLHGHATLFEYSLVAVPPDNTERWVSCFIEWKASSIK